MTDSAVLVPRKGKSCLLPLTPALSLGSSVGLAIPHPLGLSSLTYKTGAVAQEGPWRTQTKCLSQLLALVRAQGLVTVHTPSLLNCEHPQALSTLGARSSDSGTNAGGLTGCWFFQTAAAACLEQVHSLRATGQDSERKDPGFPLRAGVQPWHFCLCSRGCTLEWLPSPSRGLRMHFILTAKLRGAWRFSSHVYVAPSPGVQCSDVFLEGGGLCPPRAEEGGRVDPSCLWKGEGKAGWAVTSLASSCWRAEELTDRQGGCWTRVERVCPRVGAPSSLSHPTHTPCEPLGASCEPQAHDSSDPDPMPAIEKPSVQRSNQTGKQRISPAKN